MANAKIFKKSLMSDVFSRNMGMYKKLIVSHLDKTYYVIDVPKDVFEDSPSIESAGMSEGIKVNSQADLDFRINVLKEKGYKKE